MLAADLHEGMYGKHDVCLLHLLVRCSVAHVCDLSQHINNQQAHCLLAC